MDHQYGRNERRGPRSKHDKSSFKVDIISPIYSDENELSYDENIRRGFQTDAYLIAPSANQIVENQPIRG